MDMVFMQSGVIIDFLTWSGALRVWFVLIFAGCSMVGLGCFLFLK